MNLEIEAKDQIPYEDLELLKKIANKYDINYKFLLKIILLESKAAKSGSKWGIKSKLGSIIDEYFKNED